MTRIRLTFAAPVLLAGTTGGFIGWTVARVGCAGTACSPLTSILAGLLAGLVSAAGVGIVVVLADRSLREWKDWQAGSGEASSDTPPDGTGPG